MVWSGGSYLVVGVLVRAGGRGCCWHHPGSFFVGCLLWVSIGHAGSYYLLIGCAVRAVAGRSLIIAFIYVGSSAQINRC